MSEAFLAGLASRASLADGETDPGDLANPQNWLVGGSDTNFELMIHVASDTAADLIQAARDLTSEAPRSAYLVHYDIGNKLEGAWEDKEHFGYKDGISQPKSIGHVSPGEWNDKIDPTELFASEVAQLPGWAKNASFAVYKRLQQDVKAFRKSCTSIAGSLSKQHPEFKLVPEDIGARVIGRWSSGAPLSIVPDREDPHLGEDDFRNNAFGYEDDPNGKKCPLDSHIRLAFRRDDRTGKGLSKRIVRRGIPFGAPYPSPGARGLLFLSFQASIERQFEVVPEWSKDSLDQLRDSRGPLLGLQRRPFTFWLRRFNQAHFEATTQISERFVTTTGGGYLLYPSVAGLYDLVKGA
jgi:Dyp-type peroxidase family